MVGAAIWRPWEPSFREPPGLPSLAARLQRDVPRAMRSAHVPGVAVAVVRGGKVWTRGFGTTRAGGGGTPVTERTRFQVGSLSKPVTAWGAVALTELPLDAPLTSALRPWPLPPSRFAANEITPRRILSHTAGLDVPGYLGAPPDGEGARGGAAATLASLRGQGAEGPATAVHLVDRPGARYRYSGGGYTLLQAAIEARTGLGFAAWARRDVLAPLAMDDSAFAPLAASATGHDAAGRPVPAYEYAELAAAGLTSDARDMARFAAALLRRPARLAPPQRTESGGYALGIHVDRFDGVLRLSHEGVNRGWHARLLAYPERGWAAVVLTNGDGGEAVADAVEAEFES